MKKRPKTKTNQTNKHSKSGLLGLWTAWSGWGRPCSLQGGWIKRPLEVPFNPSEFCGSMKPGCLKKYIPKQTNNSLLFFPAVSLSLSKDKISQQYSNTLISFKHFFLLKNTKPLNPVEPNICLYAPAVHEKSPMAGVVQYSILNFFIIYNMWQVVHMYNFLESSYVPQNMLVLHFVPQC